MYKSTMNEFIWSKHRLLNGLQSALLVAAMAVVLGLLGWLIGGGTFALFAITLVLVLYLLNPLVSPRLVLGMYGARRIQQAEAAGLYAILEALAQRAKLARVPVLFYLPSNVLNAFTLGTSDDSVIAISDGLLRRLTSAEIAGVLAHEISHIQHRDTRVMGFADISGRVTSLLSLLGQLLLLLNLPMLLFGGYTVNWSVVLVLIFAPTLSGLLQLALSRTREYNADLGAAKLLRDPRPLASALAKMERIQGRFVEQIFWPVQRMPEPSLLRTHPPTDERIRRLLALKQVDAQTWSVFQQPMGLGQYPLGLLANKPFRPGLHLSGFWY